MKSQFRTYLYAILLMLLATVGYIVSCTQKDTLLVVPEPVVQSGNAKLDFITDPKVSFDKAHSNVGWETAYLGGLSS